MKNWKSLLPLMCFLLFLNSCNFLQFHYVPIGIEQCLLIAPDQPDISDFNPKWIAENRIRRIVVKNIINNRTTSLNILHFNKEGFLKTNMLGIPKTQSEVLYESDLLSKIELSYKFMDSAVITTSKVANYYGGNGKFKNPETVFLKPHLVNFGAQERFRSDTSTSVEHVLLDEFGRVKSISDRFGNIHTNVTYLDQQCCEIEKYLLSDNLQRKLLVNLDSRGQPLQCISEKGINVVDFKYSKKGVLLKKIITYNPNFTYAYVYTYFR